MGKKSDQAADSPGGNSKATDGKPISGKTVKSGKPAKPAKPAKPGKPGQSDKLSRADYEAELEPLELALNNLGRWLQHTGQRLAVVVEGRDTAGKGGVIAAIADTLSPRQCRVVALPKPNEREGTQWYFQRYVSHLPAAGEIVLFDRSWYNRAGVERVMGFCSPAELEEFFRSVPDFEHMLVRSGIILIKYWFSITDEEQEFRFQMRIADPLKQWKLSPMDLEARSRYADYGQARDRMLKATHTANAPWALVDFNDQRRGRLALIRHLLAHLPDTHVLPAELTLPPLVGKPLKETYRAGLKPI